MRLANWQTRLLWEISRANTLQFQWGRHDCCRFAAACIRAVTGMDHIPALDAEYTDEAGAREFIKREGGLRQAVEKFLGPINYGAFPGRGDICLVESETGPVIGVSTGSGVLVLLDTGLTLYSPDTVRGVWKNG